MQRWLVPLLVMWFAAAATTQAAAPAAPDLASITAMPAELRMRLHRDVVGHDEAPRARLQRLMGFVSSPEGLDLAYREDATHSIAEAHATRQVNCLAFTLLFVTLAREAGLDAYPQLVTDTLAWHEEAGTLYRSNHINAGVDIDGRRYTVDVASGRVVARHPPERVADARMHALYYSNLAMMALAEKRLPAALGDIGKALSLDPDHATHWSNAGVVHLRAGELAAANRAYRQALALDPDHAGALFNLMGLVARQGDARETATLRRRLQRVQQRDPFHLVLLAADQEQRGDLEGAASLYRKAIRLHRGEHRFHARLGLIEARMGDLRRATRSLGEALRLADDGHRAAYKSQLDALRASLQARR